MLRLFVITRREAITVAVKMDSLEMEKTALVTIHYTLTVVISE